MRLLTLLNLSLNLLNSRSIFCCKILNCISFLLQIGFVAHFAFIWEKSLSKVRSFLQGLGCWLSHFPHVYTFLKFINTLGQINSLEFFERINPKMICIKRWNIGHRKFVHSMLKGSKSNVSIGKKFGFSSCILVSLQLKGGCWSCVGPATAVKFNPGKEYFEAF